MTKRELGQRLIKRLYPKPTDDKKITLQEAMDVVCDVRDEVVRLGILRSPTENDEAKRVVPSNWLSEFRNVEVKFDDEKGKYYSDLPAPVISLPDDLGVYHVYFPHEEESLFVQVTPAMRSMYRGSLALLLEGEYGCTLLEDRLWYLQDMPANCKVNMNLIAESKELQETDFMPIDGSFVTSILDRAYETLVPARQLPEDKINNEISE